MKTFLIICALVLSVIVATGFQHPQPKSWEYKFEYEINEKKANALGTEGWEIVSSTLTSGGSTVNEYVFRRPK